MAIIDAAVTRPPTKAALCCGGEANSHSGVDFGLQRRCIGGIVGGFRCSHRRVRRVGIVDGLNGLVFRIRCRLGSGGCRVAADELLWEGDDQSEEAEDRCEGRARNTSSVAGIRRGGSKVVDYKLNIRPGFGGESRTVKKMAPIKGPSAGLVPVVMVMMVVMPRLCAGDGWQCE
jgi:hypothetical protein